MTGIILAGGLGTRLRPLTKITNKHLLSVYDKPMIEYPMQTLKAMGCDDVVLISGGEHIGGFAEYLGDRATYRVQTQAGGIAQALKCAEGLVKGLFPVILGDNYFSESPDMPTGPAVFTKEVDDPERFGVYFPETNQIIEKPTNPISNQAVTGLYVFDDKVFDYIEELTPSGRGELEVTDLNNRYLSMGGKVIKYNGVWSDMGTFDSLLEVANHVKQL